MRTPKEIKPLRKSWKNDSWKSYSPAELAMFVSNLTKRSYNRNNKTPKKVAKDLQAAQNYLVMLEQHIPDFNLYQPQILKAAERLNTLTAVERASLLEKNLDNVSSNFATRRDKVEILALHMILKMDIQTAKTTPAISNAKKRTFFSKWF